MATSSEELVLQGMLSALSVEALQLTCCERCLPSDQELYKRRAGVILHPTSLPGPYGIGEIGEHAYAFVDWLQSAGMQAWQVPALAILSC